MFFQTSEISEGKHLFIRNWSQGPYGCDLITILRACRRGGPYG